MSIIRALDVGFGSTKYVIGHPEGRKIECRLFPSLAPMSAPQDIDNGTSRRRNTAVVTADNHQYEVGPQAELALRTHNARVLNTDYVRTSEYLALARGAFHYMNVTVIDLLVVGLPVAQLSNMRDEVRRRMSGVHPLPGNRQVVVHDVLPLAQPIGGFYDCSRDAGVLESIQNEMNLVVDPGFFTLDWLVTKGLMPVIRRCGSFNGGVSAVLSRIAEGISKRHNITYTDLNAIDEGLRRGGKITLYGEDEPLDPYMPLAITATEEALFALCNTVGDGRDIKNIFLVGGGARLFKPGLERRFPKQKVFLVEDPVYANVRGFQLIGESHWRHKKDKAA